MVAPLTVGAGWTVGPGWTLGSGGGIVLTFSEFNQGGLNPGQDIQDQTGSFNPPVGFTINDGANISGVGGSGVEMSNLTPSDDAQFAANPNSIGYVWNVYWAAGSRYATTPVAMYYNGANTITFWILNPTNQNAAVFQGTFNYPATFVATSTPTSFNN
jgi:hypothetical protein